MIGGRGLDGCKTVAEAQAKAVLVVNACETWLDLCDVVDAALVREWMPDGAKIGDPLPELVRKNAPNVAWRRWVRRRQDSIVLSCIRDCEDRIKQEMASAGMGGHSAGTLIRRALAPVESL